MCAAARSSWAAGMLRNQSRMRVRKRELALIGRELLPFERMQASLGRELRVIKSEMSPFKSERRSAKREMLAPGSRSSNKCASLHGEIPRLRVGKAHVGM